MQEHLLSVDDDGRLQFIYSDDLDFLRELGETRTTRASHVEPGDDGFWYADMSPSDPRGEVLGPFQLRADALAAEVAWLQAKLHE